jgi:hypothetical protein
VATVIYTFKDGRTRKTFDAMDWLAQLVMHIPDRYEQTVRYYGRYSNKIRGLLKKIGSDGAIPTIIPGEMSSKKFRRNWARLIQKILRHLNLYNRTLIPLQFIRPFCRVLSD